MIFDSQYGRCQDRSDNHGQVGLAGILTRSAGKSATRKPPYVPIQVIPNGDYIKNKIDWLKSKKSPTGRAFCLLTDFILSPYFISVTLQN